MLLIRNPSSQLSHLHSRFHFLSILFLQTFTHSVTPDPLLNREVFENETFPLQSTAPSPFANETIEEGMERLGLTHLSVDEVWCLFKNVDATRCIDKLTPNFTSGMPSNRYETERACRNFYTAMACLTSWSTQCLNETVTKDLNAFLAPAVDTYAYICKDRKTRARFYRHGECLKKISSLYDSCADELGAKIGNLDEEKHLLQICCHQRRFLKCVLTAALDQKCKNDSAAAALETAELAVEFHRDQVQKKNNSKAALCIKMTDEECNNILWEPKVRKKQGRRTSSAGKAIICNYFLLTVLAHLFVYQYFK